jgi:hypothetical protein
MELLDRYLKAVGTYLPADQRDDILRELSEDIRSEMEEKESALARPLTEAEQEAMLKQRGNPIRLAARYRQDHRTVAFGRQLIGPELFPFYIKVLSFNLGLTLVVIGVIFAALVFSGQRITFSYVFSTCMMQLLIQMGIVTFIFAMVENNLTKHPDRWDLRGPGAGIHLDLRFEKRLRVKVAGDAQWVSRFESLSIIVASAVALAWLSEVQSHPFLIFWGAASFLKLAPVWSRIYLPFVALTSWNIARAGINLVRPQWTRLRALSDIAMQAAGLVLVYFVLRAGHRVTLADGLQSPSENLIHAVDFINRSLLYAFLIAGVISAVTLIVKIAQLARSSRRAAPSAGAWSAGKERT